MRLASSTRRSLVGDAGGDELVVTGVLAGDTGLPGDELGGQLGLEGPPGQVVLRLPVAVRRPQIGPGAELMGPVDEPPRLVQRLDVTVGLAQFVDEALEDAVVVEQQHPGLVVDLEADDGRVVGVPAEDLTDHPFGVELECRVGVVDLLPATPGHPLAGAGLAGDLGVAAGEPGRGRVGGGAEDDRDAAPGGAVEHRRQPFEVEPALLGLPGRPHRFADPDHREAGLDHQVEVGVEPWGRLIFVVVRRAEEHLLARGCHSGGVLSQMSVRP